MSTKTRPELRLIVDVKDDSSGYSKYLKVTASVVYIDPDGKIKNPSMSYINSEPDTAPWADFQVYGQLDEVSGSRSGADFYAREVEYHNPYSVRLVQAELMAKTLKRVNGRLEKLSAQFGRPDDFAAFLGHVAVAIGAMKLTGELKTNVFGICTQRGNFYTESEYRWTDVNGIRYHLNHEIEAWRKKHAIAIKEES